MEGPSLRNCALEDGHACQSDVDGKFTFSKQSVADGYGFLIQAHDRIHVWHAVQQSDGDIVSARCQHNSCLF